MGLCSLFALPACSDTVRPVLRDSAVGTDAAADAGCTCAPAGPVFVGETELARSRVALTTEGAGCGAGAYVLAFERAGASASAATLVPVALSPTGDLGPLDAVNEVDPGAGFALSPDGAGWAVAYTDASHRSTLSRDRAGLPSPGPALPGTGTDFALAPVGDDALFVAYASAAGLRVGPVDAVQTYAAAGTVVSQPALAVTSRGAAVAYVQGDFSGPVRLALMDASGAVVTRETDLTPGGAAGRFPQLAWDGEDVGATWLGELDTPRVHTALFFERFDLAGNRTGIDRPVDDAPRIVCRGLAWDGAGYAYAVVHHDTASHIDVVLLDVHGLSRGTLRSLPVDDGVASCALAWDGAGYGVAWSVARASGGAAVSFARECR